jgi:hypothetical protein
VYLKASHSFSLSFFLLILFTNIYSPNCYLKSPSDAVAAKASGMLAIGVLWGSHPVESLKEAPFDYLCKDIAELRDLLPAK